MQLTLTDREAQLLEQRLRGRTVSFSDSDHLVIQSIADRLLVREVAGWPAGHLYTSGDPDFIKDADGRRWAAIDLPDVEYETIHLTPSHPDTPRRVKGTIHNVRREGDEYACSCGARWDVSEDHP